MVWCFSKFNQSNAPAISDMYPAYHQEDDDRSYSSYRSHNESYKEELIRETASDIWIRAPPPPDGRGWRWNNRRWLDHDEAPTNFFRILADMKRILRALDLNPTDPGAPMRMIHLLESVEADHGARERGTGGLLNLNHTFWTVIHLLPKFASFKSRRDRQELHQFYVDIQFVHPCKKCRKHYRGNIVRNPIDVRSAEALTEWTIDLHNSVNHQTGKPMFNPRQFRERWRFERHRRRNNQGRNSNRPASRNSSPRDSGRNFYIPESRTSSPRDHSSNFNRPVSRTSSPRDVYGTNFNKLRDSRHAPPMGATRVSVMRMYGGQQKTQSEGMTKMVSSSSGNGYGNAGARRRAETYRIPTQPNYNGQYRRSRGYTIGVRVPIH